MHAEIHKLQQFNTAKIILVQVGNFVTVTSFTSTISFIGVSDSNLFVCLLGLRGAPTSKVILRPCAGDFLDDPSDDPNSPLSRPEQRS